LLRLELFVEVVEFGCSITSHQKGEMLENLTTTHLDTYTIRQPLGVTVGITPFNFPTMIPLWMFPLAIVTGNTSIIKPSERDPGAMLILARLCQEIGLPPGVLNVVHGGIPAVNFLCDHPSVRAISFVGSSKAGKHIYQMGTANGKRVQVTWVYHYKFVKVYMFSGQLGSQKSWCNHARCLCR
jgi:malonate-semialdehyde dehydrogenase (acetylating) / methylmalonate-semialdehyde dehydrogenase